MYQQPTTKNENRNEDCFLSINIPFFPSYKQQSRTKIDTKIVFFSINILFPSTKLSLTKPHPKPTLQEFFLSAPIWKYPQEMYFPTPKPYLQVTFLCQIINNVSQIINNVSTQPFNTCEATHKKYPKNLI